MASIPTELKKTLNDDLKDISTSDLLKKLPKFFAYTTHNPAELAYN